MPDRHLHVVHLLIRRWQDEVVRFFLCPHPKWKDSADIYWTLPTKKTVEDPQASFLQGTTLEKYVDDVFRDDLGLHENDYALEQEIEPTNATMISPTRGEMTNYVIYPVDVWVHVDRCDQLQESLGGVWWSCAEALQQSELSPTAAAVFTLLLQREARLDREYAAAPEKELEPQAQRRLLKEVPDRPSMDALAMRWVNQNRTGVRHLKKQDLDAILAAGEHAFNLRVADPYLRYQQQGVGFTWSFFTHKDAQDVHVHGAPVVEVYGVLEGVLEVWWKHYLDRGTSAWSHRILQAGDWLEVDSLQCHIVRFIGDGKGVVFKAGTGPLAEVGKLGVKGKTRCECPCMKPERVRMLERGVSK